MTHYHEEDRRNCNNASDALDSDKTSSHVIGQHPTSSTLIGRRSTGHVVDNFRFTSAADRRKLMMENASTRYVDENMTRHVRNDNCCNYYNLQLQLRQLQLHTATQVRNDNSCNYYNA